MKWSSGLGTKGKLEWRRVPIVLLATSITGNYIKPAGCKRKGSECDVLYIDVSMSIDAGYDCTDRSCRWGRIVEVI